MTSAHPRPPTRNNNIGPDGATAMAAPLSRLTSLQTLDLMCAPARPRVRPTGDGGGAGSAGQGCGSVEQLARLACPRCTIAWPLHSLVAACLLTTAPRLPLAAASSAVCSIALRPRLLLLGQWRKWRRPVKTIAIPRASAAAITSASFTEPPGWIAAFAPASAAAR